MNKYNKIVFVNGSAPALNADNLNHMDEGIEQATDGAIALETEIATARGSQSSLGARLDTADANLTKKANKSDIDSINSRLQSTETMLKNKANITDMSNGLANKADKATTLAGYGITDAYTREKTNEKLAQKLNSMPFDSEPKNNSPCYLTSGAVYNALLVKADKTALSTKYDSSNIESGTSILTPYSTVTDKIKSANCTYKTIGDIVIVSATVKMNAVSLAGNSMCPLIDLPYKCISEDNVFCVGISNLGKLFKFAIPKNNTWLQFSTQDKTAYTFADGEQINVICLYKIK
ncbi:MAG: hypothetical protein ACLS6I_04015 [Ruminococcus sp.]